MLHNLFLFIETFGSKIPPTPLGANNWLAQRVGEYSVCRTAGCQNPIQLPLPHSLPLYSASPTSELKVETKAAQTPHI